MTDEQRIALAHLRRLACRLEDQPLTDRTAKCVTASVLFLEDVIAGSPMAMQERARVLFGLMDPANDA